MTHAIAGRTDRTCESSSRNEGENSVAQWVQSTVSSLLLHLSLSLGVAPCHNAKVERLSLSHITRAGNRTKPNRQGQSLEINSPELYFQVDETFSSISEEQRSKMSQTEDFLDQTS